MASNNRNSRDTYDPPVTAAQASGSVTAASNDVYAQKSTMKMKEDLAQEAEGQKQNSERLKKIAKRKNGHETPDVKSKRMTDKCGRVDDAQVIVYTKQYRNITDAKENDDGNYERHTQRIRTNENITPISMDPTDTYPYPVDEADHCETTFTSYELILPLLEYLAKALNKTKENLKIYDPYYCEGSMVEVMHSLGFMDVYNRKEDFYSRITARNLPPYDILITNPPYSGSHIEMLTDFLYNEHDATKPFFLLMPNFVYAKDYFNKLLLSTRHAVFFVLPISRIQYSTPKGRRQLKSAKYTSPFVSFWYCSTGSIGSINQEALKQYSLWPSNKSSDVQTIKPLLVRQVKQLPPEVLADGDPRKKTCRNALKRKKNKLKKKLQQKA